MSLKPQEMLQRLKGVIALLPTHFDSHETLDLGAMKATTEYARDLMAGRDGALMIAGSTSEFYAMTDEESLDLIKTVVETVNGKVPIIAGTGRAATRLAVDMSQKAQDLGIDCAMITNPYYLQVTSEGLYRHFSKIAEKIDIGLMIYNNPTTSKMAVPVHIMKRLSKIPNIIASKENTTTLENYYWMRTEIDPSDFVVCCGIGHLYYMFESILDCPAFVTELICVCPEIAFGLYDAAQKYDVKKMHELMNRLIPYHKFISNCVARREIPTVLGTEVGGRATTLYQSIIKKAMDLRGLPGGVVREPLENITEKETAELKEVLKQIGAL